LPLAERAARDSAAVFDLTGWSAIHLTGRDVIKFLQNFCTSDMKALASLQGCETFFTNVKARVVGHAFVFRSPGESGNDEERDLDVIGSAGQAASLVPHLERYVITEDVTIRDETPDTGVLLVTGPTSAELLESAGLLQGAQPTLAPFAMSAATLDGQPVYVRRIDLLGAPGFLVDSNRATIAKGREALVQSGGIAGDAATFERLRIEAVFPLFGVDVAEDHLAPEVGRTWAISYTKGCYLGQEPIARIDALGHVNRLLRGVRLETAEAPQRGAAVVAEGKEIGQVTSAAPPIAGGGAVALAYLRTKFAESGTAVSVRLTTGEAPATVFEPCARPQQAG
jgi:folate-binding protein YgfZ